MTGRTITEPELLKSRPFWVMLIGLVIVAGGAWILVSRGLRPDAVPGSQSAALDAAPVAGHPAPDFALQTLAGDTLRLSDFKGQPVLINFWATWCPPCRAEFPDFQRAYIDNIDNLVIIGINNTPTDQPDRVADFVAEMGVTFPIVLDESGDVAETYNVLGLPTSIFIDRDGIVNELFTGPINQAYIEAKLSEL